MNECVKHECVYVLLSVKAVSLFPLRFCATNRFPINCPFVCLRVCCLSVSASESPLETVKVFR